MASELNLLNEKIVLVVDDEKFSRSMVIRHLDALGVVIAYEADNGEEALEKMAEAWRAIDIVVIDFDMPVMNGLSLLRTIRKGSGSLPHDLPVIMLTGHSDTQLVAMALSLDVDGFIVKPVTREALAGRLRRLLTTARDIKEPEHYAKIDVASFALGGKAKPKVSPSAPVPAAAAAPPGERVVALETLEPPAALSRDLYLPDGALVLPAGTRLSARLIERLRDLAAMGITDVWVA